MNTPWEIISLAALCLCIPGVKAETIATPQPGISQDTGSNAERLTDTFRIISSIGDAPSTEYVREACTRLEGVFSLVSPWRRRDKEWRILVELDSPTNTTPPAPKPTATPLPYHLAASATSPVVSLRIRWDTALSHEDFTRALVHALCARVLLAHGAAKPAEAVPAWLVEALSREFILARFPTLFDEWARQSAAGRPLPVSTFASANIGKPSKTFSLQSFWFLRFLRQELAAKKMPHGHLFTEIARGKTLDDFLADTFPEEWKDADQRALWWPLGYSQTTRSHMSGTQTMAESRTSLEKATAFVFAIGEVDTPLTPTQLIPLRSQKTVRDEIAARLFRLKVNLGHVNPVWHNAWHTYGIFLEKFSDIQVADATLLRLWENAQADIRAARTLEAEVSAALKQAQQKASGTAAPHTNPPG